MPHTASPWSWRTHYGRHWISAGKGRKEIQIADVSDIEVGRGEVDTDIATTAANARLIAAAPELLAALQEFVRMDDGTEISGGRWNAAVVMARAAIARATQTSKETK
jgi:hypothetical protein